MQKAAVETSKHYEPSENGCTNIGVSGDETWRIRGYRSSFGVVTVRSLVTGKALNTEIISKECRACLLNKIKEGTEEFDIWWESHQHECHANFFGSSGAVDPAGCLNIFRRSESKHQLRYTEFLGDSKSYNYLVANKVYGDLPVQMVECIGHIQKCMGSRLRSLKKRSGNKKISDGKSVGGKGRLTDKLIDSLQVYYSKAIGGNTQSIESMNNAVMAIWYHVRSTNIEPHHDLCPTGSTSWCSFQRDLANNTTAYTSDHPLAAAIADEILPIFKAQRNC